MKKMTMDYVGHSEFGYPTYEDSNGMMWLDINYGNYGSDIDLYSSSSNGLEGEPNLPFKDIYPDIEIEFGKIFKDNPRKMDYMMLSRFQTDCKYFLGFGNGYEGHLYFHNVDKQIEEMKKLYNSFPDNEKPEWLTMDDIEKYHTDMLNKLKEREEK